MNLTLQDLKRTLKIRLQDEDFNEEALTDFINDAQNEILGEDKYNFMQRIDKTSVCSHGSADLPLDYAGVFYVYADNDGDRTQVQFITPDEFFHKKSSGAFYTLWANRLFYRLPEIEDGVYELVLLYLGNPRPLVKDTDRTFIPSEFNEALVLGALSRAERLRGNFDFAGVYQSQQEQILINMKARYNPSGMTATATAKLPFGG